MKSLELQKRILKFVSHPLFYSIVGFFYGIIILTHTPLNAVAVLFTLATILLVVHVLYGGYYLFRQGKSLDVATTLAVIGVLTGLFFFVQTSSSPKNWFLTLAATLLIAIFYHQRTRQIVKREYLKEFCNYKTYIEIQGIISCAIGYALLSLFPSYVLGIAILNIGTIIKINYNILFKKKLYTIHYSNVPPLNNPLVSIVIITYNEEKNIGNLLDSIKNQTYKRFEVILVDDHSTDATRTIAKQYAKKIPLKIVQKEIRGQSRSRNHGALFAKGKLLLFLDADGTLSKDFIKKNIEEFNEKRLSTAFSDFTAKGRDRLDNSIITFYRNWIKTVQYYEPRGIGFCLWARKEIHTKTLFDPTIIMSEDFDYIQRASREGKFRVLTSQPINASWRRFEKENRIWLIIKYLYFETYRSIFGKIQKPIAKYDYGKGKTRIDIENKVIASDYSKLL